MSTSWNALIRRPASVGRHPVSQRERGTRPREGLTGHEPHLVLGSRDDGGCGGVAAVKDGELLHHGLLGRVAAVHLDELEVGHPFHVGQHQVRVVAEAASDAVNLSAAELGDEALHHAEDEQRLEGIGRRRRLAVLRLGDVGDLLVEAQRERRPLRHGNGDAAREAAHAAALEADEAAGQPHRRLLEGEAQAVDADVGLQLGEVLQLLDAAQVDSEGEADEVEGDGAEVGAGIEGDPDAARGVVRDREPNIADREWAEGLGHRRHGRARLACVVLLLGLGLVSLGAAAFFLLLGLGLVSF